MSNPYTNPYASPMSQPQYQGMRAPNDKPAAITVFGILNLVFGAMGLCNLGFSLLGFAVMMGSMPNRGLNPFADDPFGIAFNVAALAISTVGTITIITGGILLLQDKDLGRVLTIFYGWLSLGFGLVSLFVVAIMILRSPPIPDAQGAEATGFLIGAVAAASCFGILGLIYPGLAIFFMTRENVKAYLKQGK